MRLHRHIIRLAAPVIVLAMAAAPGHAAGRSESHRYVSTPATFGCMGFSIANPDYYELCLGSVLVDLDGTENAMSATIDDATEEAVDGSYRFYRLESGPGGIEFKVTVSEGVFCGAVADIPVPDGATALRIGIGDVDSACGAPATTGTLTLTFA